MTLENANYAHFATLQENKPMSTALFVSAKRPFRTDFLSRFGDMRSRENDIRLFSTPFDIQVNVVPEKYQMKLIELKCGNELKLRFHCERYHCLTPYDIPTLLNIAKKYGIHLWQHLCV